MDERSPPEGLPEGLPKGYPYQPEWEVTSRELHRLRQSGADLLLIDCRTTAERELAVIEGSIHVPMQSLSAHLPALRAHETALVVVHCHHGVRSLQVPAALRREGFENVRSLAGGIHFWASDVDRSIALY